MDDNFYPDYIYIYNQLWWLLVDYIYIYIYNSFNDKKKDMDTILMQEIQQISRKFSFDFNIKFWT